MEDIKETVTEQLQKMHRLMHRSSCGGRKKGHNPHRGQGRVLKILAKNADITQKELASMLDMSKQSLAEVLGKLEKNDLITRVPAEADKRVLIIQLTDEGKKIAEELGKKRDNILLMLDCLDEDELKVFSNFLTRIMTHSKELFPIEEKHQRKCHRHTTNDEKERD